VRKVKCRFPNLWLVIQKIACTLPRPENNTKRFFFVSKLMTRVATLCESCDCHLRVGTCESELATHLESTKMGGAIFRPPSRVLHWTTANTPPYPVHHSMRNRGVSGVLSAQRHRYFIFCRGLVSYACFEAPTQFLCPPVAGKLATTASHGILRVACRHRGASSAKPRRLALSLNN
jgi:hypothetical protein